LISAYIVKVWWLQMEHFKLVMTAGDTSLGQLPYGSRLPMSIVP
jgi:hypothetical protein